MEECEPCDASLTEDNCVRVPRNKRRSGPICCPVCSVTLRLSEVHSHLPLEIDKLNKIPSSRSRGTGRPIPGSSSSSAEGSGVKSWETFQKVRSNRQNRHRSKARKRKPEEAICPVCNEESSEEITMHVEKCLRRQEMMQTESDESIDVEAFEEYEWAGQSRVRITTGQAQAGLMQNVASTVTMTEEDEDLNVDGDDVPIYGAPQYSERDVILLPGMEPANVALRKAVVGEGSKTAEPGVCCAVNGEAGGDPLVEVLKNRIRELESRENTQEVFKCLICMDRYRTPVISVCCWHVYCEQCWLQTLGAKKLCPQCNMITSPSDLRKIYV